MVRVEGVLREFAVLAGPQRPRGRLRRRSAPQPTSRPTSCTWPPAPRRAAARSSKTSLAEHLGALRTCFERLTEWDGDDVPARVLVFAGDLPIRDEPLPRFLDDAAFTKLLQATRADPDPFVRLCVEFLARTGLRKGEFLDLTVDSVVQIGVRLLAARAVGQAAQRPLHPPAPAAQRPPRRAGSPTAQPACAAATCSSNTATASARTASTGPSPRSPQRPGSDTSAPSTQSHAGHPGDQPGHVPRSDRCACSGIDRCG